MSYLVDKEKITEILNISCHTAKIKKILVHQNESGVPWDGLRPTMHIMLSCKSGAFKTERLLQIKKIYESATHPIEYMSNVTAAGFLGSIDPKTRRVIPPAAYHCKGGSFLVDEMDLNPLTQADVHKAMLSFLENEITTKKVGIGRVANDAKYNDSKIEGGLLNFWNLRCNTILATMKNYKYMHKEGMEFYQGLLDRVTPIRWVTNKKEIESMMRDRSKIFKKIDYNTPAEVEITYEDFNKVIDVIHSYDEYVTSAKFPRTLNDLLRCFAVLGKHDAEMYKFIVLNRNWQKDAEVEDLMDEVC